MKDSDIKILFTDLDDTLLNSDKEVSTTDLESIDRMVKAGHKFVVATGRPFYSADKLCKKLGFIRPGFYLVCSNGGVLYDYDKQDFIKKTTVTSENISYVFDLARKAGLHIHTYTNDYVVSERETEELIFYCDRIKMPYKILDHIPEDLPYLPPKMVIMSSNGRSALIPFEKSLHPWIDGKMSTVFSSEYLLEVLPIEATKGNGVRTLCSHFNIPIENSICCGDEENDISMIVAAGIGVAMKNGTDSVKAHADYITCNTNNENAITEVIEKFILS